jgi:hypothetical protein
MTWCNYEVINITYKHLARCEVFFCIRPPHFCDLPLTATDTEIFNTFLNKILWSLSLWRGRGNEVWLFICCICVEVLSLFSNFVCRWELLEWELLSTQFILCEFCFIQKFQEQNGSIASVEKWWILNHSSSVPSCSFVDWRIGGNFMLVF